VARWRHRSKDTDVTVAPSENLSWLQRASAWVHRVNRQRLARRKLRKQRAAERAWLDADDPRRPEVARALQRRLAACGSDVKLSVVVWPAGGATRPASDRPPGLIQSMYPNWELLLPQRGQTPASTDVRIRTLPASQTAGSWLLDIAVRGATGSHLAVVPEDWRLAPHALLLVAEAIGAFPDAQVIYGDDDCIDSRGRRHSPCMRCDWNLELLRSTNYLNGIVVVSCDALRSIHGLDGGTSRDAWRSLLLHVAEQVQAHQVLHVPHVLAHRLTNEGPSHQPPQVGDTELAVVQSHLDRCAAGAVAQGSAEGGVHVRYPLPDSPPWVSLIVPTRNGLELLRQCVQSIIDRTEYSHYEIVIVDNGSDDRPTLQYLASLRDQPRVRVHRDDRPFNFSALNNAAARICRGAVLGLINNDIEVISGDWLREMVGLALRPDVGAVGARLWFADDTLQHAGVVLGIGGVAGHVHRQLPRSQPGYQGRACLTQEFSAVTAACTVLRREVFDAVGGLDETNLEVDYNDIDLCLRIRRAGYRVIWTPHAQLYHHESATRGRQRPSAQQPRYDREVAFMRSAWHSWLHNDPAYNPNLTLRGTQFELSDQPRVSLIEPWFRTLRLHGPAAPVPVSAAAAPKT
jgi:GT2 family glycosyltransferase